MSSSALITLQKISESCLDSDQARSENREEGISVVGDEQSTSDKRKLRMENMILSSQKQKVTLSIPVTHELKFKPDVSMMKPKAEKCDTLINPL